MSTSPWSAPSTTASSPSELTKSIDCGLTCAPDVPPSETVSGENPPMTENLHDRSRADSVWSPVIGIPPHPAQVTYEKIGFRTARGLLRSMVGRVVGTQLFDDDAHGTSNERALRSLSCGSHERTHRPALALAVPPVDEIGTTWWRRPRPCCPTATHSPPARTLNAACLWKQHAISFKNGGLFGPPGSTVRFSVRSIMLDVWPKRPTWRWSEYASRIGASRVMLKAGFVPGAPNVAWHRL